MITVFLVLFCICFLLYSCRIGCATVITTLLAIGICAKLLAHWKLILLILIGILLILVAIVNIADYIKYKDEAPEQREERLKQQKMIEDWRKQFNKF